MRRLLAAAAALVVTALAVPATAAPDTVAIARTVVAFVPDLSPGQPVRNAATGALVVATARKRNCAADAWLTLSAGAPAAMPGDGCGPPALTTHGTGPLAGADVAGWAGIVGANAKHRYGARPGALATAANEGPPCVGATGPLAALGAADETGHVAEYHDVPTGNPYCDVQLVDATGAASLDAAVDELFRMFHPYRLILVGLPRGQHLGAVAQYGERSGLLTGSTRRTGLVTLADLNALIVNDSVLPVRAGSRATLADLDRREHLHRRYNGWYVTALISLPLLLYIYWGVRRRVPRRVALAVAAFPAAGFLASAIPWWRTSAPGAAVINALVTATLVLAIAGALAARALRAPAEAGVAAACAAVFVVDLLAGGRLQATALASYSAIAGGRFYGIGNAGFAVLATAAVIATGAVANRWGARVWLLLLPVIALDALAGYGADFGGAIALTAAFVAAVTTRARKAALAGGIVAGVAVAVAAAVADYARPAADRTHLGRFVGEVLHGGWYDTVARKAHAATHSVTGTWYPLLLAGSIGVAVYLLRRQRRPELDTIVRALAVLFVAGSLLNDSGIAVAGVGLAVAGPLLLSYAERP